MKRQLYNAILVQLHVVKYTCIEKKNLFQNTDADLSQPLFLKKPTCSLTVSVSASAKQMGRLGTVSRLELDL